MSSESTLKEHWRGNCTLWWALQLSVFNRKSLSEWPSPLKPSQHEHLMDTPLSPFSLFMNADLTADTAIGRKTYEEERKRRAEDGRTRLN